MYDVAVIGAGPIGLACAIESKKQNLSYIVIDKGYLVNSLFIIPSQKPKRVDALNYYWRVANHYNVNLSLLNFIKSVEKNWILWFLLM